MVPQLRSQAAVGRELAMLGSSNSQGWMGRPCSRVGFQFGCGLRKGIAEIIESDAIENDAERVRFVAQAAGAGVNTRRHSLHCQSCAISSFLRRVPLRMRRVLPQCGQRAGGLTVCGTRGAVKVEWPYGRRWLHFTTPPARHGFWKVWPAAWLVERQEGDWLFCGKRLREILPASMPVIKSWDPTRGARR